MALMYVGLELVNFREQIQNLTSWAIPWLITQHLFTQVMLTICLISFISLVYIFFWINCFEFVKICRTWWKSNRKNKYNNSYIQEFTFYTRKTFKSLEKYILKKYVYLWGGLLIFFLAHVDYHSSRPGPMYTPSFNVFSK